MTATLDESQLASLLRGIDIPACPAILIDMEAELRKDDPDQRTIAKCISRDVALSGQVMQVANSPAFSTGRKVDSIIQALTVLGMRQMFNLVVTQLLKIALAGKPEVPMDHFWEGSAAAARVAAELARRLRCVKPDMAYTFSLFHDCGMPLLMKRFDDYQTLLRATRQTPDTSLIELEEQRYGTNHAVVGYFLARRWKLPEFVAQGIALHHDYAALDEGRAAPDTLGVVAINALAEHLVFQHNGLGEEDEWDRAAEHVFRFFGLGEGEAADLTEDMLDWLAERRL